VSILEEQVTVRHTLAERAAGREQHRHREVAARNAAAAEAVRRAIASLEPGKD